MNKPLLLARAAEVVVGSSTGDDGVLRNASIVIENGLISDVVMDEAGLAKYSDAEQVDCSHYVLTPGFVDSHTHALFGDWRAREYDMRVRGLDYMAIARLGGGINASVTDVRRRTIEELVELTLPRIQRALEHGTTTLEIKSGYGLSCDEELKMLRAIAQLAQQTPMSIVPTFLGAHDVPLEYRERRADYVRTVSDEMIPAVAMEGLARFCDVFMEPGAFTGAEARAILEAGARHDLIPKLHADEFENSGGAELAAALGAASADHLGAISDAGVAALAASNTVATLLPATLFFLGKQRYAPARRLIDAGARVALATDFNPGTAPSVSMPLVLTMACSQMRMTPLEALVAATQGGALALHQGDRGVLKKAARADILAWRAASHVEVPYSFGQPPLAAVWKDGKRVV